MKFIVRYTKPRVISHLIEEIPNLLICEDRIRDAMDTFFRALKMAEEDSAVHLEDDIILTSDFYKKITSVIEQYSKDVIQFFSMRKDDILIGTRYINGSQYMMNQCFYLPKGMSKDLLNWSKTATYTEDIIKGAGCDILMANYFKEKKIKYLNYCPNLVDHKISVSLIDKRRSSKRQSKTFIK